MLYQITESNREYQIKMHYHLDELEFLMEFHSTDWLWANDFLLFGYNIEITLKVSHTTLCKGIRV